MLLLPWEVSGSMFLNTDHSKIYLEYTESPTLNDLKMGLSKEYRNDNSQFHEGIFMDVIFIDVGKYVGVQIL